MDKELILFNYPKLFFNIKEINNNYPHHLRGIHCHNSIEIITGIFSSEWAVGDEFVKLLPDDILIINQYTPHGIKTPPKGTFTYIQIDIYPYLKQLIGIEFECIYEFIMQTSSKSFYLFHDNCELRDILDKMISESKNNLPGHEFFLKSHIFHLIAFMNRFSLMFDLDVFSKTDISRIKPVIEYIEENFNSKILIDDICKEVGYNKFTLCKHFKQITGQTIVDYINFLRLRKAKELILKSEKSISQIALDCGFSSIQYFNKTFKKNIGCSPLKFRCM